MHGTIPNGFGKLLLTSLEISSMYITGTFPADIGNITTLKNMCEFWLIF